MKEQFIAQYDVREAIGEGGLGQVYRARNRKAGRTVALKILPATIVCDPTRLAAVVEDARAAAALSHPNIATLLDIGHVDDTRYLAYEFIVGASLRNEMGGRPMNPRRALGLVAQVADGLSHAHAAGVLHGDLRPETIALTGMGSAKLLDTGMSRWTRGEDLRRTAAADPSAVPPDAIRVVCYICHPSRRSADRWMDAPTSSHSRRFCTRCSPAARRSGLPQPRMPS